jgi:hypothetical protein
LNIISQWQIQPKTIVAPLDQGAVADENVLNVGLNRFRREGFERDFRADAGGIAQGDSKADGHAGNQK